MRGYGLVMDPAQLSNEDEESLIRGSKAAPKLFLYSLIYKSNVTTRCARTHHSSFHVWPRRQPGNDQVRYLNTGPVMYGKYILTIDEVWAIPWRIRFLRTSFRSSLEFQAIQVVTIETELVAG